MIILLLFISRVFSLQELVGKGLVDGSNSLYYQLEKRGGIGAFIFYNSLSPEIKCQICKPFEERLLKVIQPHKNKPNTIFARMDLKSTREIYSKRKIETVPTLEYYPPCTSKGCPAPILYQTGIKGPNEGPLADFLEEFIGPPLRGRKRLYMILGFLLMFCIFLSYNFDFSYSIASSKWTWAVGSFVILK
jgi:hypothetical protein